eukprot:8082757-Heterocapsa_arctica.AAC.1
MSLIEITTMLGVLGGVMEYERERQYLLRVNPGEPRHTAWVVDMLENRDNDDLDEIFGIMGYGNGYGDELEHELEEFE